MDIEASREFGCAKIIAICGEAEQASGTETAD
jgi:hypothetical protein